MVTLSQNEIPSQIHIIELDLEPVSLDLDPVTLYDLLQFREEEKQHTKPIYITSFALLQSLLK